MKKIKKYLLDYTNVGNVFVAMIVGVAAYAMCRGFSSPAEAIFSCFVMGCVGFWFGYVAPSYHRDMGELFNERVNVRVSEDVITLADSHCVFLRDQLELTGTEYGQLKDASNGYIQKVLR